MTEEERQRLREKLRAAGVEAPAVPPSDGASPAQPPPADPTFRRGIREMVAGLNDRVRRAQEEATKERGLDDVMDEILDNPDLTRDPLAPKDPILDNPDLTRDPLASRREGQPMPAKPTVAAQERERPVPRMGSMTTFTGHPKGPRGYAVAGGLAIQYAQDIAVKETGKSFGQMTSEQQRDVMARAKDRALREVAGIERQSDLRGNMLVPVYEDKILDDVMEGRTALGYFTGQRAMGAMEEKLGVKIAFKDTLDEYLAPFHALAQPGFVKGTTGAPQREGRFWWATRATGSTVGGAWVNALYDPDTRMSTGEKAAKMILEGYDITQDWRKIGKAAVAGMRSNPVTAPAMPFLTAAGIDEEVAGVLGTAAIILVEPDITLLAGPAGKIVGAGARAAGRAAGFTDLAQATVRPALDAIAQMRSALDSGKELKDLPFLFSKGTVGRRVAEHVLTMATGEAAVEGLNAVGQSGKSGSKMGPEAQGLKQVIAESAEKVAGGERSVRSAEAKAGKAGERLGKAAAKDDAGEALLKLKELGEREKLLSEALARSIADDDTLRVLSDEGWAKQIRTIDQAKDMLKNVERAIEEAVKAGGAKAEVSFETAKGSTYRVGSDGTTTRNKAARPEHPGDSGLKEASERTVYVEPDVAMQLGMYQSLEGPVKKVVFIDADGNIMLLTKMTDDAPWTKMPWSGKVMSKEPKVGLHPLELWGTSTGTSGTMLTARSWHPGSAITKVADAAANSIPVQRMMRTRSALIELIARTGRAGPARVLLQQLAAVDEAIRGGREAAANLGAPAKMVERALKGDDKVVEWARKARAAVEAQMAGLDGAEEAVRVANANLDELRRQSDIANSVKDKATKAMDDIERSVNAFLSMDKAARAPRMFNERNPLSAMMGDPGAFRATARARYGDMADGLIRLYESGERSVKKMRDAEEAVFNAMEFQRVQPTLAAKALVDAQVAGGPLRLGPEGLAAGSLRLLAWAQRVVEPVHGISRLPKFFQESVKRHMQRLGSNEIEVERIIKMANSDPEQATSLLMDYLTTNKAIGSLVGNRDVMPLMSKTVEYLRMVAEGNPEDFANDRVVKALARAWLPAGKVGAQQAGRAEKALFDMVRSGGTANDLVDTFNGQMRAAFSASFRYADDPHRAMMFLTRAVLTGASQYDLVYDWWRGTASLNLGADAAKAFDLFAEPTPEALEALKRAQADLSKTRDVMAYLGEPLVKTAYMLPEMTGRAQALVKLAINQNDTSFIPTRVWKAVEDVPRKLEKELAAFDGADDGLGMKAYNTMRAMGNVWRMAMLMGWFAPRARYFTNQWVGDWSQTSQSVGFGAATRLALSNMVTYVPFIGGRAHDALSNFAARHSVFGQFVDPDIARIMAADPDFIIRDLPEGPMSAVEFSRECQEAGTLDAISSDVLREFGRRVENTGAFGFVRKALNVVTTPSPLVRAAAEMFEATQHRQRTLFYLQARTGRLDGIKRTPQEAKELLAETLYDYRTGVGQVEMHYIGWLSAFWVYRRNMWRQLGSALTEPFTEPTLSHMGNAMWGNTKVGRTMKGMRSMDLARDVYLNFGDDEYALEPNEIDKMGRAIAPWFADSIAFLGNKPIAKDRRDWNKRVLGKDAPYEAMLISGITWYDQMLYLNAMAQFGAAATVALQEAAGLKPNVTHIQAAEMADQAIELVVDQLMPGFGAVVEGFAREVFDVEAKEGPDGFPVERAYQVVFQRQPWIGELMGAQRDAEGRWRIPRGAAGMYARLAMSLPQPQALAREWAVFDNASANKGMEEWFMESLSRYASPIQLYPNDPFDQITKDTDAKVRALKELQAAENRKRGR